MKATASLVILCGVSLASQSTQGAYKLLPPDRWGDKALGGPVRYPNLARIARISGDVITAVVINKEGKAEQLKHLSGPLQLRPTAESMIQSITFRLAPEDGAGPWLFVITSKFSLNDNNVYCFATPKDSIPFNLLWNPVSSKQPSDT